MKLLDLAKFKKVAEDDKTATLKHEDGHTMTVLVGRLPKIQAEQLKRLKMADGGVAHYDDGAAPVSASDASSDTSSDAPAAPAPTVTPYPEVQAGNPLQQQAQGILNAQKQYNLGAQQGEQSQANQAAALVPINQVQIDAEADRKADLLDKAQHVTAATQDFADYQAQHPIDPQLFGRSQSDAQKVTTALGLLVGGFTGGFNGTGNNPAYNWLKDQQDKSIAAQQANLNNRKTVLGAYQDLFKNSEAAAAATRMSDNNAMLQEAAKIAHQQGTLTAQSNLNKMAADFAMKQADLTQKAAGYMRANPIQSAPSSAPGSAVPSPGSSSNNIGAPETPYNPPGQPQPTTPSTSVSSVPDNRNWTEKAANILWGGGTNPPSQAANDAVASVPTPTPVGTASHILTPEAESHYQNINTEETTLDAQQKSKAIEQYNRAVQVDKGLDQIERIFPQVKDTANWSGWVADHAGSLGAGAGALTEVASAALAPVTGMASLVGALPAAAGVAGGVGAAAAGLGSYFGGQQELQHEALKRSLRTQIEGALDGISTPTEITRLVDAYTPTVRDDASTYALKLKELKNKIISLAITGAIPKTWLNKQKVD